MSQLRIEGEAIASRAATRIAVEAASDFARRCGLTRLYRDRLCVVVEELVTNVVSHGRAPGDSVITFAFEAAPGAVSISMSDAGAPFDPREPLGPRTEREGGWGWPIIMAWCRIAAYRRADDRNHLELTMPADFDQTGGGSAGDL